MGSNSGGGSRGGRTGSDDSLSIVQKWVNSPQSVAPVEKSNLADLAKKSKTDQGELERIFKTDPDYRVGDIIDFGVTSFTGVNVSGGKAAGGIGWKSSDGALGKISNPRRGYDVPYNKISAGFNAKAEKETIVSGRYRVVKIDKVVEPGTNPNYGYTVKQYVFEEL